MTRFGMVVDVRKCIGCWSCAVSCRFEHFLPAGMYWNRVLIGETGRFPSAAKEMYPVLCNHCEDAPCVAVCPTGASHKNEDEVVLVDYDRCMGCRYCVVACPYQQRTFYDRDPEYYEGQGKTELEKLNARRNGLQMGTVVKCTFCAERIEAGREKGLVPGVDREATPACVNACPVQARVFGDLDDPNSNVSTRIRERRGEPLHPEFNTKPCVYYVK
jgi:phenylacetyl-CoA:acceptor oxidoreductase subunit 1